MKYTVYVQLYIDITGLPRLKKITELQITKVPFLENARESFQSAGVSWLC